MANFFFKIAPHNGAMNYFDSAIGNDILSVHYQIGGWGILQKLRGKCVNFLCKLKIFMLANSSMKEMINLQMKVGPVLQLMNYSTEY